ncbi:regulator of chromosome condensation 1/beta-lactamase-inhibitor protein II [Pavlovales sp. CCMP2436]|nr:regulator of chromosome condensation 1/beta-lactamase-inhibitor protein II [Pavlovales sp. CCMP2436]
MELTALAAHGAETKAVAFGARFAAATDTKGQLWLWAGAEGSMRPEAPGPWRVKLPEYAASVAATHDGLVVVTMRGRALMLEGVGEWVCALDAAAGALVTPASPPRALGGDAARRRIVGVSGGGDHALLLDSNGAVLAVGANDRGQLGLGGEPGEGQRVAEPRLVGGALAGRKVAAASCGERHSLCVTEDGKLFAFGDDKWLQLGLRDGSVSSLKTGLELRAEPTEVDVISVLKSAGHVSEASRDPQRWRVLFAAAGGAHSLIALRDTRSDITCLVSCGHGRWGQLGDGLFRHISAPREVKGVSGREEWDENAQKRVPISVRGLAAGSEHSAALLSSGDVMVWGHNGLSQQGTGNRVGNSAPTRVRALTGIPLSRLSCARNSCAAWAESWTAAQLQR